MANEKHKSMQKAKACKCDEFYTRLIDIERELKHYSPQFADKTILCNCDDPGCSNFYKYFVDNFECLGLKKIICIGYSKAGNGKLYIYNGEGEKYPSLNHIIALNDDGDFRGKNSIRYLEEADIVVTNPPFSLFRDFINIVTEYNKKFLVIGNVNSITYKDVFRLIQDNKVWLGVNMGRGISGFIVPKEYELYGTETSIDEYGNRIVSTNGCLWLTNLDNNIRNTTLPLTKVYYGNELSYPKYDNYDAINVDRTNNIPSDYFGAMGVPITFLHKFNPNQFEIIKFRKGDDEKDLKINGKAPYFRILIKRKI